LEHFLFSIIYGIILPIDLYFSGWLKPPTSHVFFCRWNISAVLNSWRLRALRWLWMWIHKSRWRSGKCQNFGGIHLRSSNAGMEILYKWRFKWKHQ
jgi:hypothetical protein